MQRNTNPMYTGICRTRNTLQGTTVCLSVATYRVLTVERKGERTVNDERYWAPSNYYVYSEAE